MNEKKTSSVWRSLFFSVTVCGISLAAAYIGHLAVLDLKLDFFVRLLTLAAAPGAAVAYVLLFRNPHADPLLLVIYGLPLNFLFYIWIGSRVLNRNPVAVR